ncbi:MAG TPA: peptidylprolyl isomerase [Thermoanaerobaculia bacterium]|nr:peptidylprolyl isomerase [Thermoanaerobaculia bacterium]
MSRLPLFCCALLLGTLASAAAVAQAPPASAPAPAPAAPAVEKVDPAALPAIVAEYTGGKITKEELLSEAQYRAQGLAGMGMQVAPDSKAFLSEVLDMMLAARMLLADSTALGLTPADTEVAAQFEELKQRFGNEDAYRAALLQQGTTEEALKSDLKENLAIQKLIETQLVPAVKVEDPAIQAFYEENIQRMIEPESFHASHILLRVGAEAEAAERAAVRARAEALLAKAKAGEEFAALARESSEDPGSKERGGDLGWVRKGQTVPQFEQAALALEAGALSGVVESPFGYHLILLHEKRPERKVPLEEAKPRIQQVLGEEQLRQVIEKRVGALREKAGVKTYL